MLGFTFRLARPVFSCKHAILKRKHLQHPPSTRLCLLILSWQFKQDRNFAAPAHGLNNGLCVCVCASCVCYVRAYAEHGLVVLTILARLPFISSFCCAHFSRATMALVIRQAAVAISPLSLPCAVVNVSYRFGVARGYPEQNNRCSAPGRLQLEASSKIGTVDSKLN